MMELVELNERELLDVDGGFIITGAMVVAGLTCLGTGVAVGYAIGKIFN